MIFIKKDRENILSCQIPYVNHILYRYRLNKIPIYGNETYMSNKHPQYLTANGLLRQKKRPTTRQERKKPEQPAQEKKQNIEMSLSTSVAKRVIKKRRLVTRNRESEKTISPAAAKMIAEAIKGLLHS